MQKRTLADLLDEVKFPKVMFRLDPNDMLKNRVIYEIHIDKGTVGRGSVGESETGFVDDSDDRLATDLERIRIALQTLQKVRGNPIALLRT